MNASTLKADSITLLFATILLHSTVTAQKKAKEQINLSSLNKTVWVSYNPFNLLEPEIPMAVTVMYKNNRIAYALDGGAFIAKEEVEFIHIEYNQYGGYRFKPEIRYYFKPAKNSGENNYFGLQCIIKKTYYVKDDFLQSHLTGSSRLVRYKEKKLVLGGYFLAGDDFIVDNKQRIELEVYVGIGARNKKFTAEGIPAGFIYNTDQNGAYITAAVGAKVGVRINRNKTK